MLKAPRKGLKNCCSGTGSVAAENLIFGASLQEEFHGNLSERIPFLLEMLVVILSNRDAAIKTTAYRSIR